MPKCAICEIESVNLYKCKRCGDLFCEECGDLDEKLCLFCLDEEMEDYDEDDDDEDEDTDLE